MKDLSKKKINKYHRVVFLSEFLHASFLTSHLFYFVKTNLGEYESIFHVWITLAGKRLHREVKEQQQLSFLISFLPLPPSLRPPPQLSASFWKDIKLSVKEKQVLLLPDQYGANTVA